MENILKGVCPTCGREVPVVNIVKKFLEYHLNNEDLECEPTVHGHRKYRTARGGEIRLASEPPLSPYAHPDADFVGAV